MPELARFFGIVVYMNWRDHNPPHIHALYGEHEALVSLDGAVLAAKLSRLALSMVLEWLAIHRTELVDNWTRAQQRKPLQPIEPLE
jgi:hypothetical protein